MGQIKKEALDRIYKLCSCNISDALDKLGINGCALGILPMFSTSKIAGPVVTIKMTAAGLTPSKHHLGVEAITKANPGDIIVIDNGGRKDVSCWGEILGNAAKLKEVSGVVIDGASRDIDDNEQIGFPVYAKAAVPRTARNRIMQESYNCIIQLSGVQVRPGDILLADKSGVVIIPQERLDEVIDVAESLANKEIEMVSLLKSGKSLLEIDQKYSYEKMLKK